MVRVKRWKKSRDEYMESRLMELQRFFPSLTIPPEEETSGTPTPTLTSQTGTTLFSRRFVLLEETGVTRPSEDRISRLESQILAVARFLTREIRSLNRRIVDMEGALGDIAGLRTVIKRRANREEALTLLVERLKSITLPNPEVHVLKTGPRELRARVVIDDTDKYLDYLEAIADVVGELHRKYDLEMEVMLFQRSELLGLEEDIEKTIAL